MLSLIISKKFKDWRKSTRLAESSSYRSLKHIWFCVRVCIHNDCFFVFLNIINFFCIIAFEIYLISVLKKNPFNVIHSSKLALLNQKVLEMLQN